MTGRVISLTKKFDEKKMFGIFRNLTNCLAELNFYGWDEKTRKASLKSWFDGIKEEFGELDPNNFTDDELRILGFGKWDESGLRLIPLYLKDCIKKGTVVYSITGELFVADVDKLDDDSRFGFLSYGVYPKDIVKKSENANASYFKANGESTKGK